MATIVNPSAAAFQSCIDACTKCLQACEECLTACLKEPDVQARIHCIQMLRDCADICALASQWMSRSSMHAKQICQLCATLCEACAADCAKFQDAHCQACADECRKCAEACRKMSM